MKKCQRCGKNFEPKDDRPTRPARFCSRACGQPNQRARVMVSCCVCRKKFERKRYHAQKKNERGRFCSFDCYGVWQTRLTGDKNPNWIPNAIDRSSSWFQKNRLLAIERDGGCVDCGTKSRLHVHHVGDPDIHDLDNLKTLCASCHRKHHPLKHGPSGKFLPL